MRKNPGFTLVEMLVVIVLVAVVGFILLNLFISHNRIYRTQSAELDITGDIRGSLDNIDNDVRQSTRVLASYSTFTAGSDILILQIPSINSSSQIVPAKYDYVVYNLSSGQLNRQVFADASSTRVSFSKVLTSHITALTFTYNNADFTLVTEVATDIAEAESVGFQTRTVHYNSKARLRNY